MFGTTLILAIREIRRHLLRSFLTTLGIVIGVAAVVTMVTLGNGATAAVSKSISSLGSNILNVNAGQGFGRGGGGPPPQPFKLADVDAIRSQVAGIKSVAPQASASVTAIYEGQNWATTINGTTNDYLVNQQWATIKGRAFSPAEEQAGKSVCIIGTTVSSNLFAGSDPIGKRMRVGAVSCDVIGLLARRGTAGFGQDQDDTVLMPIKTVMRRFTGNQNVRSIQISVDAAYDSAAVQDSLKALLRERRGIRDGAEDDFNIFDTAQIAATLSSTKVMTSLLAAVAAVSLIVGGIGIMNIMLVSVTERTREIGIRLAIGAVQREVLMQFLVEAVALSCLGGLLGLALALVATVGLTPVMGVPFTFDPQINLLAFFFSALIGVVFGYFPARRAAALNPIDALRHE